MYKFGQIEIESKKFNSIYEVQKDVDLEKIRVSEGCRKTSNNAQVRIQVIILDTKYNILNIYISSVHSSAVSVGRDDYNIPFLLSYVVL